MIHEAVQASVWCSERPRVEGERASLTQSPYCDKAINVDSVSQWVKGDAVTDSTSVCAQSAYMCVSEGSAPLRSYQKTMGHVWAGHSGSRKGNIVNEKGRAHCLSLTSVYVKRFALLQQPTHVTFPVFVVNTSRYKSECSSSTQPEFIIPINTRIFKGELYMTTEFNEFIAV